MDELYLIEQEEAIRRAEYETRHAEALRRAESQATVSSFDLHPRYRHSKSATTSPIMRNTLTLGSASVNEVTGFPLSTDICSRPTGSSSRRRLSGPVWSIPQQHQQKDPPLTQSRSSGHIVDSMRPSNFNHHHSTWTHPYHHQCRHPGSERARAENSHPQQLEDSPSPISSDSELPGHDGIHKSQSPPKMFHLHGSSVPQPRTRAHMHNLSLDNSPPLYSSSTVRTSNPPDFVFTPSASPFLGPLRTLNIHSTTPSRAPSPIFLPPSTGPGEEATAGLPLSHSRAGSGVYGSPPLTANSILHRKQHHHGHPGHGYGSPLPTPQLSSGPSSNGSSSGSFIPGPTHLHPQHQLGGNPGGSGTLSASGSRAPSPIQWGHGSRASPPSSASTTSSFHHVSPSSNGYHLAHSVRAAFGMTPIHSHPPSRRSSPPLPPPPMPRNTSWSASSGLANQHQYLNHHPLHSMYYPGANPSLPGSRSGSPPIKLAPLKTLPSTNASTATTSLNSPSVENPNENHSDSAPLGVATVDQQKDVGVKKEKVELPGFSQFEAAARGTSDLSIAASSVISPDARMSIDFVR